MKLTGATVIRFAIVTASLSGAIYSAVSAGASYLYQADTAQSVAAAAQLLPNNATYLARLSAWQPRNKQALLRHAIDLNPFDYQSWIQLGLTAEMEQHDLDAAEKDYLRAADVNHMFLPSWTLTNFYFRHQQPAKFFQSARKTLQVSPYQAQPVFAEMAVMSEDENQVADSIPPKPTVLLQYAAFLATQGKFRLIPRVTATLVHVVGKADPSDFGWSDQLLPVEDRILNAGFLLPALDIWSSLVKAGWLHVSIPTLSSPLTNGNFAQPSIGHGFDWLPSTCAGVNVEQSPDGGSIDINLSGDQPERCVLIRQFVPLQANGFYTLQWKANVEGSEAPAGIDWHVHPIPAATPLEIGGPDLTATPIGTWRLKAPGSSNLSLLTLEYTRPIGQVRFKGTVSLSSIVLQER